MNRDDTQTIEYHRSPEDVNSGFGVVNGVNIWTRGPYDDIDEWRWEARRWDGKYSGGVPRMVAGIGAIEGRASSETEAVAMATIAAEMIGHDPSSFVVADVPVRRQLVTVADDKVQS